MDVQANSRDLFIVDNSVATWTGLSHLEEWTKTAKAFDIATGYFEIGALTALDGKWQSLDKVRILMGADTNHRSRRALLEAVTKRATEEVDAGLEHDKDASPFLAGVSAVLSALRAGRIECRVYDKDKFHAKAYIARARRDADGARALVGSSNFTKPGLSKNVELNVQIQRRDEVAQLQDWFDRHWQDAVDVTGAVIEVVERHVKEYSPFEIYAKALQEYFRGHELTETEWDETRSRMFSRIDRYQKEAHSALMKIAQQYGGAFLCDGVGLGKTFVGLMLIERLVLHEGKRVVLFAPKAAKEGVWEPHLREWLPHIGGGTDFSNLAVFSHTDLGRGGDFPERFRRIADLADVVIIDEAHHFRNPGRKGDTERGKEPSRYYQLYDLLNAEVRPKTVFMLTATPINNRLSDFRHMTELFTRRKDDYFARTLGVNNLKSHFNQMEKALRGKVGHEVTDVAGNLTEAQEILATDTIFKNLVVQRSRAYARESQLRETGKAAAFPERKPPQVAEYSIKKTYGRLLDMFENAFTQTNPLFTLAMYYPLAWYKGTNPDIDAFEENRQKQVVGLIRTNFLKRFESSVVAFELSCDRLLQKLLAFLMVHCETPAEKRKLDQWTAANAEILGYARNRQLALWPTDGEDEDDEDVVPEEMLEDVEHLDRGEYNIPEMITETYRDLDQIVHFLAEARKFEPKHDDKLQKLIRLLKSKELAGQKVLIFTEFADTARYLEDQLGKAEIDGVAEVDSASKANRAEIIRRFAPYYNGSSSTDLSNRGDEEIRVLISTDVLSEGLNLQDASRMINYDIHWNPVRLMQRIGRVDRRMNPDVETRLVADHPEVASSRGKVSFWNFLPPDELNEILTLYTRVTQKTLMISKTLGIEGRKLLHPNDLYDDLKVMRGFDGDYEGQRTVIEDMHLEYQALLRADPTLEVRLSGLPGGIYSGRKRAAKGVRGLFFCYALPAFDKEAGEFTHAAGTIRWYLHDLERDQILEEPSGIVASIRSGPETSRRFVMAEKALLDARGKIEKHIKNSYLKRVDAPVAAKPALKCWMELNEG